MISRPESIQYYLQSFLRNKS